VNPSANRSQNSHPPADWRDPIGLVAAFIEANYDRPIRLADLAWEARLSVSRVAHHFREKRGLSPMEYVLQIRLGHARRLLETTDLELRQVAELVGFRSTAYFGRVFKKRLGASPGQYRAAARRSRLAAPKGKK
jgi:transcriptional regulator GlxA family with amidase domain